MTEQSPFSGLSDDKQNVALRISILARLLRRWFDRRVSSLNATRAQWTMISTVSRHPGATQRAIADVLDMSEASAGRLIDKLCRDGFLVRQGRDDDRRARAVYITEAAKPFLDQLAQIAEESETRVFRGFSAEEMDMLRGFIARIYKNIS